MLCYLFDRDNSEDLDDSTTLKVHFKDLTCIKYRRDMYMTWDGLFGNEYISKVTFFKLYFLKYGIFHYLQKPRSVEFSVFA